MYIFNIFYEFIHGHRIKTHTVNLQGEAFLTSDAPTEDARNLDYIKLGKEEMDNEDDFEDDTGLGYPGSGSGAHKPHSVSFMIERSFVQVVKKSAKEASKYPLMEEYDFKNDQAKTQKKLEEIYESLKKHFTNEKDEK